MSLRKKRQAKRKGSSKDLLEIYHEEPICKIPSTSPTPREDAFDSFRPEPRTVLDYHISQTETKMDAGHTKIHIKQTDATYEFLDVPLEPRKKKPKRNKFFSGGPPQWEFLEEIWRREQDELQKIYQKQFKERVALRKKTEKLKKMADHRRVIKLVGPEWYQELSPNQLRSVDNLKNCILRDLQNDTIINTQENIGYLGLVLRPSPKHIKKSLLECCKCPVEFLLVLYQLMNPNRTKYSINDRLLLSAVVHLTMRNTLKELHIRIPSPPRPQQKSKMAGKKKKSVRYESPYLEPFTFQKETKKFTGVYVNKHKQYPESPYFSYLDELKKMKQKETSVRNSLGSQPVDNGEDLDEIAEETKQAQTIYEALVDYSPVEPLLKPSKYNPCYNFFNRQLANPPTEESEIHEIICVVKREINEFSPCGKCRMGPLSIISGIVQGPDGEAIPIISGIVLYNPCDCLEKAKTRGLEETCGRVEYIDEETQAVDDNNCEIKSCECLSEKDKKPEPCIECPEAKPFEQTSSPGKNVTDEEFPLAVCKHCRAKNQKIIDRPLCNCERCKEDRRKNQIAFVISGMKTTEDGDLVPIISGVYVKRPCKCLEDYEKKVDAFEKYAQKPCKCKEEGRKIINKPLCDCDKCQEDRSKKNTVNLITGIAEIEEEAVPIIDRVNLKRPCKCLEQYDRRIEKYEEYEKRKKAVTDLKQKPDKYIVGGVVNTREGPVYCINGIRPPVKCKCPEEYRKAMQEEKRIANMPHAPPGRIKYGIAGVKETPEGNVYILNQALPTEDCDCMKLYEKYENQHTTCMQVYQQYLNQMKDNINKFNEDLLPSKEERDKIRMSITSSRRGSDAQNITELEVEEREINLEECSKVEEEKLEEEKQEKVEIVCEEEPLVEVQEVKDDCCKTLKSSQKKKKKKCYKKPPTVCCGGCGKPGTVCCKNCTCGPPPPIVCPPPPPPPEPEPVIEEPEEEKPELKRFFIFDKIDCNYGWHMSLLKKALASMAADGYPLAKLPECHKLPHFKLWMQLRCGQFWTLEDRYTYTTKSKNLWRHTDVCIKKTRTPKLPISKERGHELTWASASYCKKLASDALDMYYRRVRKANVNAGREFFPTLFDYEFPFSTFRDCFFAYTPAKEEEVLAVSVWAPYEVKNFSKRKSCLC